MRLTSRFIIAFFVLIALATLAWAAAPKAITFEAKPGKVVFSHAAHQSMEGVTCKKCHHNMPPKAAAPEKKCRDCHLAKMPGKKGAPNTKDAFHKACQSCHKERKVGPQKCYDCHQKPKKGHKGDSDKQKG
jgi:hypothetical protein